MPFVTTAAATLAARDSLAGFEPWTAAERAVIANLSRGGFERLGDGGLPEAAAGGVTVRAELIRVLVTGGPDVPRIHEKGIRVVGALLTGTLDLEGCRIARSLCLIDCRLDGPLILRGAVVDAISLDGSTVPGLFAERLDARDDLTLRGAVFTGPVRLPGCRIGGSLVADAAAFDGAGGPALDASGLEARGSVVLRGARAVGAVALGNATLSGDLEAAGLAIDHAGGLALDGHGLTVAGNVVLRGASVRGETMLDGTTIGGDLDLSGGRFHAPDGSAFAFGRSRVDGAFILRAGAAIEGHLALNGTTVGLLVDDPASWPAAGNLSLNHFRYGALLASPVGAGTRLAWLALQDDPARIGDDFWPQPYETLAEVLAGMGHDEDAREVLFEKEKLARKARRARASSRVLRALLWARDATLGATVGYGRKGHRAFAWLAVLWVSGALLLAAAAERNAVRPNVPVILRSPEWVLCGYPRGTPVTLVSLEARRTGLAAPGQSQLACWRETPESRTFPRFDPWMFAGDSMLPALDSGQRSYWAPDTGVPFGAFVKGYIYVTTLAGWALSLLAVAAFSGIVRSR